MPSRGLDEESKTSSPPGAAPPRLSPRWHHADTLSVYTRGPAPDRAVPPSVRLPPTTTASANWLAWLCGLDTGEGGWNPRADSARGNLPVGANAVPARPCPASARRPDPPPDPRPSGPAAVPLPAAAPLPLPLPPPGPT